MTGSLYAPRLSIRAVAGQMIDAVAAARRRAQRRAGGSVLRRSGSPR